ncbi:MAG TPA: prepilin-type N-terminal cleavage/methylation domain-containing protein [Blastocatellia bacterium]|nr:prepilin-type N-terminal cleavage/methylation domain-containing protein [Blastocatellia bacterium]
MSNGVLLRTWTIRNQKSAIRNSDGFTLLELVMVMTIIVILAAVAVTSYQHIQLKARETILQHNVNEMRKLIDQYAADRERLPSALDDLVTAGYMRDIPVDPTTGDKDWVVDMGEDTISRDGGSGVIDVHSSSPAQGSDGRPYREY